MDIVVRENRNDARDDARDTPESSMDVYRSDAGVGGRGPRLRRILGDLDYSRRKSVDVFRSGSAKLADLDRARGRFVRMPVVPGAVTGGPAEWSGHKRGSVAKGLVFRIVLCHRGPGVGADRFGAAGRYLVA